MKLFHDRIEAYIDAVNARWQVKAQENSSRIKSELDKERAKSRDAVQALDESMQREHTLRASMKALEAERDAKLELTSDSLSIARSELVSFCACMHACVCVCVCV